MVVTKCITQFWETHSTFTLLAMREHDKADRSFQKQEPIIRLHESTWINSLILTRWYPDPTPEFGKWFLTNCLPFLPNITSLLYGRSLLVRPLLYMSSWREPSISRKTVAFLFSGATHGGFLRELLSEPYAGIGSWVGSPPYPHEPRIGP